MQTIYRYLLITQAAKKAFPQLLDMLANGLGRSLGISRGNTISDFTVFGRAFGQSGRVSLGVNTGQVMGPIAHLNDDIS